MATFAAVLDACVLFPVYPRDLLLRLAEAGLYRSIFTREILDEVARNLVRTGRCSEPAAVRLVGAIATAFSDDMVEPGAAVVVTANLRDFPAEALEPWSVQAKAPDEFLVDLFWLSPARVVGTLAEQAQGYASPPVGFEEMVEILARVAPAFASLVREYGARRP
jgi:hypothetical protein